MSLFCAQLVAVLTIFVATAIMVFYFVSSPKRVGWFCWIITGFVGMATMLGALMFFTAAINRYGIRAGWLMAAIIAETVGVVGCQCILLHAKAGAEERGLAVQVVNFFGFMTGTVSGWFSAWLLAKLL